MIFFDENRANASVLIGTFLSLYLGRTNCRCRPGNPWASNCTELKLKKDIAKRYTDNDNSGLPLFRLRTGNQNVKILCRRTSIWTGGGMRTKTYTGRMSLYARAGCSPHFLSFISIFSLRLSMLSPSMSWLWWSVSFYVLYILRGCLCKISFQNLPAKTMLYLNQDSLARFSLFVGNKVFRIKRLKFSVCKKHPAKSNRMSLWLDACVSGQMPAPAQP